VTTVLFEQEGYQTLCRQAVTDGKLLTRDHLAPVPN
jgi:hypothetical protein